MPKAKIEPIEEAVTELRAIKQLLILALVRDGIRQNHIAKAIGVDEATISRAFPKGLLKTIKSSISEQ